MRYTTVTPAYGRDYKSAKAAKEDWQAGKDFIIADFSSPWDGKPMSIADVEDGQQIMIRYKQLTQITKV